MSYLLQPHTDRSLLVPLAELWRTKTVNREALKPLGPNPKEYVLLSLGQASILSPHIAASLKGPAPTGFSCDTKTAHEFLTLTAPSLEQAGFGVMVAEGVTPGVAKPLKTLEGGVFELALRHRGDAFRAVYALKIDSDIWVIHAFQKKSKRGIKTPQMEIDLIRERLKRLQEMLR